MTAPCFTLFETTIGLCGIAWGASGVIGVQLPERGALATRGRMLRRHPDATDAPPPPHIQQAIEAIVALLRGEPRDLSDIAVDMAGVPAFNRRVYDIARQIPPGATLTYGEIATRIGEPGAARDVGQALGRNPFPIIVPCHRVVASGGRAGGFSAPGGVDTKLRLLAIEGFRGGAEPTLFDTR